MTGSVGKLWHTCDIWSELYFFCVFFFFVTVYEVQSGIDKWTDWSFWFRCMEVGL